MHWGVHLLWDAAVCVCVCARAVVCVRVRACVRARACVVSVSRKRALTHPRPSNDGRAALAVACSVTLELSPSGSVALLAVAEFEPLHCVHPDRKHCADGWASWWLVNIYQLMCVGSGAPFVSTVLRRRHPHAVPDRTNPFPCTRPASPKF